MTPPAAAAAPRTRTKRATPPPRRVSGPARTRSSTTVVTPPPLALRLGGAVHGLAEHHFLDRLIRGRAWIGIIAVGLIGIVFMQVSMLRLNAGIGQAVERTSALERQNSAMRAQISELSSVDRIAAEAAKIGLVLPPGTPRFLDAREADATRALASITIPGEGIVPSATTTLTTPVDPATSTTPVLGATGVAPAPETDPAATSETPVTPAATDTTAAPTDTTTATQTAAPATTQEQAAAPPPTTDTGGIDASQVG